VFAPRSFVAVSDGSGLKAPKARLELQWIYSFRGNDCRNNLKWLNKTTMVYNAASLVVGAPATFQFFLAPTCCLVVSIKIMLITFFSR
jgi:hypothetical protein